MDDIDPDLFDEEVSNHIMWKYDSIAFTPEDKFKIFLTGMASLFYSVQIGIPKKYIPLKKRKDLSRYQKVNIGLASIWVKEKEFLEDIIAGKKFDPTISKEKALEGLDYITEQYEQCKNSFYKK